MAYTEFITRRGFETGPRASTLPERPGLYAPYRPQPNPSHTSSRLEESEVAFALAAIDVLDTTVKTLVARYERRGPNGYCVSLRSHLSTFRGWLDQNGTTADPSLFHQVLDVIEDVCEGRPVSQPRPLSAGQVRLSERYPELMKLASGKQPKDAKDTALHNLYFASGGSREILMRRKRQENLHERLKNALSKLGPSEIHATVQPQPQAQPHQFVKETVQSQQVARESEDDCSAHVSTLYRVLARYSTCQNSMAIVPRVSLREYRTLGASGLAFSMLFPDHPHLPRAAPCSWQKAVVQVGPDGTFDDTSAGRVPVTEIDPRKFCGIVSTRRQEQLCLSVSERSGKLFQALRPSGIQGKPWIVSSSNARVVSLGKILADGELAFSSTAHLKAKTVLFYQLVRGACRFYDSELMGTEWTKDSIEFLVESRHCDGVTLAGVFLDQPLVSADFKRPSQQQRQVQGAYGFQSHSYPKILELGVMLLEILLGRAMDTFRREPEAAAWMPGGQVSPYTDYCIARWLFGARVQKDDDTPKPLRDVIARCLDDQAIRTALASSREPGGSGPGRKSVRDLMHHLLVMPLESMIQVNYDDKYNLKPVSELPRQGMVPSAATGVRPRDIELGRQWLDDLDKVLELLQPDRKTRRARVVVLDTGFSPSHGDLQYDIEPGNYKDFVDGRDDERRDLTGHGTSVVRLIFHVLDDIDVYVARVLKNEKSIDEGLGLLEKGIQWAAKKDADILVMAIGSQAKAHDGVRRAINQLPDKVIVMASAGNRGQCERVVFPARMLRTMAIFATTGGNHAPKSLNPCPLQRGYNFGFLGVDIQPEGWAEPLSGTTYAVAIAGAFAASLLNFSRQAVPPGERTLDLEGHEKMNHIFEELARDNVDQEGYQCVVPWRLLNVLQDGQTAHEHRRRRIRGYLADLLLQRE